MNPAGWRKKKGIALRPFAEKLGRGWSSLRRWESGEREAPNGVALAYEKESNGEVTSEDFNRVRRRFLRAEHEAA